MDSIKRLHTLTCFIICITIVTISCQTRKSDPTDSRTNDTYKVLSEALKKDNDSLKKEYGDIKEIRDSLQLKNSKLDDIIKSYENLMSDFFDFTKELDEANEVDENDMIDFQNR